MALPNIGPRSLNAKPDDRYSSPFVVTKRTRVGNYVAVKLGSPSEEPATLGRRRVAAYASREPLDDLIEACLARHPESGVRSGSGSAEESE